MKKSFKYLTSLIGALIFISMAFSAFAKVPGVNLLGAAAAAVGTYVLVNLLPSANSNINAHVSGIQKEIWVNYIIERLWKDNQFLKYAWNDDDKVLAGKVVHIPNPGARPSTSINRSSFPATAVRRTDTDIVYSLDEYTTDPTHIENAEMVETSYDKINSVIGDHIGYLTEDVADNLLLRWLDESVTVPTKIYTSGAAVAVGQDDFTGGVPLTGTRNAMLANDIKKIKLAMDLQKVPKTNRFGLIEANMMDQLLGDLSQTQYRDFSASVDAKMGIVGKLYGITLFDRSSTVVYNTAHALKAFGATGVATDCYASIFWQQDCVTRALGEVKMFSNVDRPEYYGDIYSALLRMGGRRRRADDNGVIALIAA